MKLTIIHPSIGRRKNEKYLRSWQMEPLPAAIIAGLTPSDIDIRFYDDRNESIPFDDPTDLVAISVETYTAKRAYQIASDYRRRNIPVVMGGFHASLCPEEVAQYAESVLIGEAEECWSRLLDDFRHGSLQKYYRSDSRPSLKHLNYDRSIYQGKRYLPIGLIEAGRGCHFKCEFCAIQSVFNASHNRRPVDDIIAEIKILRGKKNFFFFIDDNVTSNMEEGKELLHALIPLNIKWVAQSSINAAHDKEFLALLVKSGCKGLLIGFESLNKQTLQQMGKGFNQMGGGYEVALANLRHFGIRIYATFVFGYEQDTAESFEATLAFAMKHKFYLTAFNHLTPFPGTPLYQRLKKENRLSYESWWLDSEYSYNIVPFKPVKMTAVELQAACIKARGEFYSISSMLRRGFSKPNRSDAFMFRNFFLINQMHRAEVKQRNFFPLGDQNWQGELIKAS
ncbi:MAG: radical SAM protein [Mariprofundaceae bacterium]|nr:radical SAM protein [Mariprofundaceae bacterium]